MAFDTSRQFVVRFRGYRDETAWSLILVIERRLIENKGWQRVSTTELLDVLEPAGLIQQE